MEVSQDLFSTIKEWFEMARLTSYRGTIIGLLPGLLCWHIWKERCSRRFSSLSHSLMQVISYIIADCNCILEGKKFNFFRGDTSDLANLGFKIPTSMETWYMIMNWMPPKFGLKGNVDGSSSLSSSGGVTTRVATNKTKSPTNLKLNQIQYFTTNH